MRPARPLLTVPLVLLLLGLGLSVGATDVVPTDRSTYVGGSEHDEAHAIDVGPDGRIYLVGQTLSRDFPGDPQLDLSPSAFVAVLSADATRLEWSQVFGGTAFDAAYAVKATPDRVYVAGQTESSNFPTQGAAVDTTYGGNTDAFLAAFALDGTLQWSGFVGGAAFDTAVDMDVDSSGRAVVGGTTLSCDFATTPDALRAAPSGCTTFAGDAYVSRYATDGALSASTLFGGGGNDRLFGVAVAAQAGAVFLTGVTDSTDLPVGASAAQTRADDAYVARINANLTALGYATYLGGSDSDWTWDVARDDAGNAYVTGHTYSSDFPTTPGAYRRTHASPTGCPDGPDTMNAPCQDAFVTKVHRNGTGFVWSTLLGGTGDDEALGIALDPQGGVYVAGMSDSGDSFLPARAGDRGFADAFVAGLKADGTALSLMSGLSGSDWDAALGLDVAAGRVWTTGFTWSADYPTSTTAFDRSRGGVSDGFASSLLLPLPPSPTPTAAPQLAFDHRGGNEWWVEVDVTGAPITRVEARDTGGAWVPLTKRSWGVWAGSFHIEPGHGVQFRALTGATWIESCWFTHPAGVEQCTPTGAFSAVFSNVKGNEWWIEARVDGNKPIARVDVSLNGGPLKPLELKSWGSWARSYHAPSGTIVRFTAWSSTGESSGSSCYRWTTATVVSCTVTTSPSPTPAAPVFDHRGGNEWWVETTISGSTPSRVEARDTNGAWVALSLRSWGAWAGSFHIEPGHDVQFRAVVSGTTYESCWFTHPAGAARTGGTTCGGTRVA